MKPDFQYPLTDRGNSFRVFYKAQDKQNIPLHYHPDYEMNFVIKGNGRRIVGSTIENFEAGEIGFACGYECLQFYYRQFTRYVHCSPGDYRRKIA